MADRKGKRFMLWCDLECSGSGDDEEILEIGAVLTDSDLNEIDARNIVLPMMPEALDSMADVVVKMHTDNGLISDSMQLGFYSGEMGKDMHLAQVDEELERWIRSYAGGDHVPFAGSGVAHYDRKFIQRDLPRFNKRLTYYAEDIGSVRRIVKRAGLEWPQFHLTKEHRALEDARQHIEEARRFLAWCQKAKKIIGSQV
jgi:oligoribonuclease